MQKLGVNRTYRFSQSFTRDSEPFVITGGSVYLRMRKPDRTIIQQAAVINGESSAYCDFPAENLAAADVGVWSYTWRVVVGGLDLESVVPSYFNLQELP